jgi:hypothetical protein
VDPQDDDAMDVDQYFDRIRVKTTALDQCQRDLVLGTNLSLYPPELDLYEHPMNTEQLFGLRGMDFGRVLPEGLIKWKKLRSIVLGGGRYAGKHMEASLEFAKARDASADASQGPAKGPVVVQEDPPLKECVKVFFHLDSQTPNIEFVTENPQTKNTMSCRLFARDLLFKPETGRVCLEVEKYMPTEQLDRCKPSDEHEHGALRHIETMSQTFEKTCLIKVTLRVEPIEKRHWKGITETDLAAIRQKHVPAFPTAEEHDEDSADYVDDDLMVIDFARDRPVLCSRQSH